MNPYTGKEEKFNDSTLIKNGNGRSVIVVGGGPGGIEAAITAAKRGFDVTLFDKGDKLGGMLILAGKGKGKEKITWSLNGMIGELKKLGVKVNLNKEVTSVDKLRKLNPYTVIVATGGDPIVPSIPGLDRGNVYLAHNVLKNDIRFNGKKIAVIGSGMTGLETAEVLLEGGNKIVMYDMLNEIANGAEAGNKFAVMDYLSKNGTMFKTGYKLKEVTGRGIVFDDLNLNSEVINDADIIVLSLGVKPNKKLAELFDGKFERILTIGDCAGGSKISHATMAGLEKVWAI
jgi:NADPH-dependent 2,4-dienoyl-CoA reductase/sulfur reductase-like enzyme